MADPTTFTFKSGKWNFKYYMSEKGGLVLEDVMHDNYNLAKHIRVLRIWINPDDDQEMNRRSFYLGTYDFDIQPGTTSNYQKTADLTAPAPFDIFTKSSNPSPLGLQAIYKSKEKVFHFDNDPDDDWLTITQSYICTPYGKNPAHEPGGVLQAARIFPLIKFHYNGKKVRSIRVDYNFGLSLDVFLKKADGSDNVDPKLGDATKIFYNDWQEIKRRPNMGGIFRDSDQSPPMSAINHPTPDELFAAFEKPIQYEVCGYGLIKGYAGYVHQDSDFTQSPTGGDYFLKAVDNATWDNYHQWGGYKDLKKYPSTPGAFHCFHMHWRWSLLAQHPDLIDDVKIAGGNVFLSHDLTTGAVGEKQLQGYQVETGKGGALVDPKIPNQTIRLAVTKEEYPSVPDNWNVANNPSERIYESLFYNAQANEKPRQIKDGTDIAFWLSFQVNNFAMESLAPVPVNSKSSLPFWQQNTDQEPPLLSPPFEGTVCIHGFYFAHDLEDYGANPFGSTIGKGGNKPVRKTYEWHRDAE